MEAKSIISKIKNPSTLRASDEMSIKQLLEDYPYFQAAHALHLRLLKQEDSFEFKKYLRITALHTANRGILFDFINRDLKEQEYAVSKISKHQNEFSHDNQAGESNSKSIIEDKNTISIATNFDEKHSFSEWLMLTKLKPLDKSKTEEISKNVSKKISRSNLIEKFISDKPKIPKASQSSSIPQNSLKTMPSQQMMTETLAKIYLEQKKYDKAIQAYNILILNNPKKSGFFADQIKIIQSLQENN
jgi:hypothetical protein